VRVLVIGGTNFIGPPAIAELHRRGHEVTVYHRGLHEPELPPGTRHIHSPRAAIPVLHFPSALSDPPPDVVLHMFPVGEEDSRAAAARFTGLAERIVAISSGDVYRAYGRLLGTEPGPAEPVPLGEDAPLREINFPYRHAAAGPTDWTYHYDKILAERALLESPLPATVLRLPAVYGPGDPHRRFRPYIKRMLDRRPFILVDSLQAGWRWTHGYVENVARAIVACVTDERAAGRVFNVGESATPTVAERIGRIAAIIGWRGTLISLSHDMLPQHLRPPYQPRQDLILDSGKIRDELGYAEAVSEEEGLQHTINGEGTARTVAGDPGSAEYAAEDEAAHLGLT
jgi:nucleoside-diphosphate-sugar epimerase